MSLTTQNISEDDIYYTEEFKTLIRSHRDFIIAGLEASIELDKTLLFAFKNNFYGYLNAKGVAPKLWWVCAYLSGIKKPYQDISRLEKWYLPDIDAIDQLISRSNTIRS